MKYSIGSVSLSSVRPSLNQLEDCTSLLAFYLPQNLTSQINGVVDNRFQLWRSLHIFVPKPNRCDDGSSDEQCALHLVLHRGRFRFPEPYALKRSTWRIHPQSVGEEIAKVKCRAWKNKSRG